MDVVGRDAQVAALRSFVATTAAGAGRALVALGEAGMGKSLLSTWPPTGPARPGCGCCGTAWTRPGPGPNASTPH